MTSESQYSKLISDPGDPDWKPRLFAILSRSRVLDASHVPDGIVIVRKCKAEQFHHFCEDDLCPDNQSEHFTRGKVKVLTHFEFREFETSIASSLSVCYDDE